MTMMPMVIMKAMLLWVFGWGVRSKKLEIEMTLLSMVHQNDVDADGKDDSSDVFPKGQVFKNVDFGPILDNFEHFLGLRVGGQKQKSRKY